ncbi:hypothetical protein DESC_480251 [Desulfosarcina cetonica]|nr:hypothetical protein DESC_480251 [Desulfosarcina cetonica]
MVRRRYDGVIGPVLIDIAAWCGSNAAEDKHVLKPTGDWGHSIHIY